MQLAGTSRCGVCGISARSVVRYILPGAQSKVVSITESPRASPIQSLCDLAM